MPTPQDSEIPVPAHQNAENAHLVAMQARCTTTRAAQQRCLRADESCQTSRGDVVKQRSMNCKSRYTKTGSTHLSQLFKSGWFNTFFLECDMTIFDYLLDDLVIHVTLELTKVSASTPLSLSCQWQARDGLTTCVLDILNAWL